MNICVRVGAGRGAFRLPLIIEMSAAAIPGFLFDFARFSCFLALKVFLPIFVRCHLRLPPSGKIDSKHWETNHP